MYESPSELISPSKRAFEKYRPRGLFSEILRYPHTHFAGLLVRLNDNWILAWSKFLREVCHVLVFQQLSCPWPKHKAKNKKLHFLLNFSGFTNKLLVDRLWNLVPPKFQPIREIRVRDVFLPFAPAAFTCVYIRIGSFGCPRLFWLARLLWSWLIISNQKCCSTDQKLRRIAQF